MKELFKHKHNYIILKTINFFLLFFLFFGAISLQAQSERDSADLVLELKVLPNFPIGYANCFQGVVSEVIKGKMPDEYLAITVLAGDTTYERIFNKDPERNTIEIGFKKNKTGEQYSHAYITGFVDKKRTSWKIIYAKIKKEEE